jgi:hypothetical protein
MKDELIFRYKGDRESFQPIHDQLVAMGLKVRYNARRCSVDSIEGFLQSDPDVVNLSNLVEEKREYFTDKGITLEKSCAKYALDRRID